MPIPSAGPLREPGPDPRFMWITPDRLLYVGLLGAPARRTLGSVAVYGAPDGPVRVRFGGQGPWQSGALVVVPPQVPHEVATEGRLVHLLAVEAETVDPAALPPLLRHRGPVSDPHFVARVRTLLHEVRDAGERLDLAAADFDTLFFGGPLAARRVDPRIQQVIDLIKRDASLSAAADDCARAVHLSFSRFLHLFRQEAGVSFRSFRTWKRARSLLLHVKRDANLAHVALDTGYPDSTHFSHSIRQVYGLKPRDIFAGSRRLAVYSAGLQGT